MTNRTNPRTGLTEKDSRTTLRDFLATQSPGTLEPAAAESVIDLLAACWHEFEGCDDAAMHNGKLGRAEELAWHPPVLSFVIERHGGTVLGSTRAELQRWNVDLDRGIATWEQAGRRQLTAMSPRLNVKPIAEEVARHIIDKSDHPALTWGPGRSRVSVRIGQVIPQEGFKMTVQGRRKRFKEALRDRLLGTWRGVGTNVWEPVPPEDSARPRST
jgi:hypothetical protein